MNLLDLVNFFQHLTLLSLSQWSRSWYSTRHPIPVPTSPPDHASGPLPEAFLSYTYEWSSFPDFTGNSSVGRNEFSYTLINNIGEIQGAKPYVRVGGNTQDYSWYNATLDTAILGTFNDTRSPNYPTTITIGPSFYDSYKQWPGVKFINDFNQAHQGPEGLRNLRATVGPACKALSEGNMQYWEFGNEGDIYPTTNVPARPLNYTIEEFVAEWVNGTRTIKEQMMQECPELVTDESFKFIGPSFSGPNDFDAVAAVKAGMDIDDLIAEWSMHAYMGADKRPGNTLRGTIMNHTHVREVMDKLVDVSKRLNGEKVLPFAITEVNSLSSFGQYNISDVFGAALWTLDWNLYGASTGAVQRIHMQQGTNARYSSWQPIDTDKASKGVKPPYYGDLAVATAIGKSGQHRTQVAAINLPGGHPETDTAYGIYEDGVLARVAVINLEPFNQTSRAHRYVKTWRFDLGECRATSAQGLSAPGSDAKQGITFDGYSYHHELGGGRPVKMDNVAQVNMVSSEHGSVQVDMPASSAVIIHLKCR